LQTFSVPGSMYLSILGGALWGVLIALPLVCFCVATGALLCYLMSAALGPAVLRNSEVWRERVEAWTDRVAKHDSNLVSYLIVLRIAPLPPHWMVNVVAPHLGISVWKFWLSTFLGPSLSLSLSRPQALPLTGTRLTLDLARRYRRRVVHSHDDRDDARPDDELKRLSPRQLAERPRPRRQCVHFLPPCLPSSP
ncbi:uncharacterized protein RHOBADRAFT_16290, partial [Rhodotorula graminis WP1]